MGDKAKTLRIPVATYRLQFNQEFRFADAKEIIPYLAELGISDIYASPCFRAVRGSMHGYDIVDHTSLNPELGSYDDHALLSAELKRYGMGQLFDIVPNHMSIEGGENGLWMDVLENGKSSPWSAVFDIDWNPETKQLENRILIPILGDQYGNVLDNGELTLRYEHGSFTIHYYEHVFPVEPGTYTMILEHAIEDLKERLPVDSSGLTELLSIITAIGHLPDRLSTGPDTTDERQREKEVIKKRLERLYDEDDTVRDHVLANVEAFNGEKGRPGTMDLLDTLLNRQVYRLSNWKVATEEINYRRFFDINSLAAIRIEDPDVFRQVHKLVFELISNGTVTGLRVDHPDGLYDPTDYFTILQEHCSLAAHKGTEKEHGHDQGAGNEKSVERPFYIVGEKILTGSEKMPDVWPIYGTTGYSFMNLVNGVFVDHGNAKAFDRIYSRFVREKKVFHDIVYEKKKLVMQSGMSSEVNTLGHYLNLLSEKDRHTRDFTLNSLIKAIVEVIASFPVYRTYIREYEVMDRDRHYIESAVSRAVHRNPAMNRAVFDFLRSILLMQFPSDHGEQDREEWLAFVMKFQQITGPVMAKGLEDTAFYVYNRLISVNEVGGSPERFGVPLEAFHGQNIDRMKGWSHAMLATSTHDTKRSEDVRARINVLSEIPDAWNESLKKWSRLNRKHRRKIEGVAVPDRNEEYLLYQTLLGIWPVEELDAKGYADLTDRVQQYMIKAMREGKENTSWISPVVEYEGIVIDFIGRILRDDPANAFLEDFIPFQKALSRRGMINSLSQTLLKITSPGMPDLYQGTELWSFALVDPDNRRPVDYAKRGLLLKELYSGQEKDRNALLEELMANMDDGRIKLYLTASALRFRKENRELFEQGEYVPLETGGEMKECVCAFARRGDTDECVTVVPRFMTRLTGISGPVPPVPDNWKDTVIILPSGDGTRYENVLTGEVMVTTAYREQGSLYAGEVFARFPVALLRKV